MMCASIIESPRTRSTYVSPLVLMHSGTVTRLAGVLVRLDGTTGGDLADDRESVRVMLGSAPRAAPMTPARSTAAGRQAKGARLGGVTLQQALALECRRGGDGRPTWRPGRRPAAISRTDGG